MASLGPKAWRNYELDLILFKLILKWGALVASGGLSGKDGRRGQQLQLHDNRSQRN